MNGLLEILTNKQWMIRPEFVHGVLPTIQNNLNNHTAVGINREKKLPMLALQNGTTVTPMEYQVTENGVVVQRYGDWGDDLLSKMSEPFVNVMPVDGPITRDGGACSYGSKEIRDWMMEAANNQFCQGHVITINTPGGSAWAKNDFRQGIDYAHERGQRVVAFVDGLCASAGMYLAALCDEVYVMNPNDELGCVGVMAAFFTMKNGEKDPTTGETYREYYATKSVNKNKEIRDIADDDDAKLLIAELDKLEAEFRADMQAAFPHEKDEHLDGKLFPAKEVMGVLCDGQMMLGDVVERVFAIAKGEAEPVARTAGRKMGAKGAKGTAAQQQRTGQQTRVINTTNNSINMKEKFPALFAALQVEEMQMKEGGAFMNEGLLETLNGFIEAKSKEASDAKALADQLTAEKAEMEQKVSELTAQVETINGEHAAAIEKMAGEHKAALEEKDATIETLTNEKATLASELEGKQQQMEQLQSDVDGAKASLETATNTIAERDQAISDLNAQIEELSHEPGEGAGEGNNPASNGEGANAVEVGVSCYVYDTSLSYDENMKRKAEFEKGK